MSARIFYLIGKILDKSGLRDGKCTIVDSSIISALSSTKNKLRQ